MTPCIFNVAMIICVEQGVLSPRTATIISPAYAFNAAPHPGGNVLTLQEFYVTDVRTYEHPPPSQPPPPARTIRGCVCTIFYFGLHYQHAFY